MADTDVKQLSRLTDELKQLFKKLEKPFLGSDALGFTINQIQQAVSELKSLDSTLSAISRTSNLTKRQLKDLGQSAFDTASKYGRSASDYLTAVREMYSAGFDNAEQMSQLSMLAQAAGELESSTAHEYLTASNAAYDLKGNVEELNKVLDGQSYLAKNAAITMEDMAQATSQAASTASRYGVQADELSALIAAAVSNTHESGIETGNALNAIFANLQDTASRPIQKTFDAVNISMMEMADGFQTLKTPIELLRELSGAFAGLEEGDSRRETILSSIGGEDYADTLSALLSNWASYEQLLGLYSQGMGNAAREAKKTANSWEGSLNRLSNTWTDTVANVADSDAITAGINALNGLLGTLNHVTDFFGSMGTIGLGAGLFAGIKNVGRARRSALI